MQKRYSDETQLQLNAAASKNIGIGLQMRLHARRFMFASNSFQL